MRKKKEKTQFAGPNIDELQKRIGKIDSGDLLDTLEIQLSTLCRYVPDYRKTKDPDYLGEMLLAAEAFYVIAAELRSRKQQLDEAIAPARQTRSF